MNLTEDMSVFFDSDGFGVEVTVGETTFDAILDRPYREALGVAGEGITLSAAAADLTPVGRGGVLTIGGNRFEIVRLKADRSGRSARAQLIKRAGELIIRGRDADLWDSWLDEENPLSAMATAWPGTPTPTTIKQRQGPVGGGTDGEMIFSWQRLDTLMPAGSTIIKAELFASGYLEVLGAPDWKVHPVLQSMIVEQATWNQFRSKSDWAIGGAKGVGTDYDIGLVFGEGTGIGFGYQKIAEGDAFTAWVESKKTTPAGLVVHSLGGPEGEFEINNGATAEPPYLRVEYV